MRRRIVNHHKLIKSFDRTADKTERFFDKLFKNRDLRKKKDFTWKGTQYSPYKREDTSDRKKLVLELSILAVSVISLVYLIVFSGLFNITHITISGNKKITTAEIETVIKNTLDYKTLRVIPNSSYFLANIEDISEVLKRRFPIDTISITKEFPHDLKVEITEKISTIIYDNSSTYALVGLDGSIIELVREVENHEWEEVFGETVTTTADGATTTLTAVIGKKHVPDYKKIIGEVGDYPLIYDKRGHVVEKGLSVLTPEEVRLMIEWYNGIKNNEFGIRAFVIENDIDFSIETREGWIIKGRFIRTDTLDQLRELKLALGKIDNTKNLSYIDLRYENRIYWK